MLAGRGMTSSTARVFAFIGCLTAVAVVASSDKENPELARYKGDAAEEGEGGNNNAAMRNHPYRHRSSASSQPYYRKVQAKKPKAEESKPTQQCDVLDEVLVAEICTPDVSVACSEEHVMTTMIEDQKECFQVSKLVCDEGHEEIDVEVCTYVYESKEIPQPATLIDVEFEKKCEAQMVTVCKPQGFGGFGPPFGHGYDRGGYGGYGGGGKDCKDISQNTCYNKPTVATTERELKLVLPEPRRECQSKPVMVPKLNCRTETEEQCLVVPKVVPRMIPFRKCLPVIMNPKCDPVELILPKQVCKDVIVGYAHKVKEYKHPSSWQQTS